jgi:predicted nucleic acid-binding protein
MLLDTNAYSALARGVPAIVDVVRDVHELSLSLPVIAELRYGFVKGSQNDRNEQALQRFISQPQVSILAPTIRTTELYAQLQWQCQRQGRALSHNDIWISALALESNNRLVTFDQDFAVFADVLGDKLLILE